MTVRLTVLGTSPPIRSLDAGHAGTGTLLSTAGSNLLIDCGPGVAKRFHETANALSDLDGLVFTHHHWDHVSDIWTLVLGRWEESLYRAAEGLSLPDALAFYGPAGTERIIETLFGHDGLARQDIDTRLEFGYRSFLPDGPGVFPHPVTTELAPGESVRAADCQIFVSGASHCEPIMTSLSYRIETNGVVVAFAGDSGPSDDVVALAAGADLLVHEGAVVADPERPARSVHSDAITVGCTAAKAGVARLLLNHHMVDMNDEFTKAQITKQVRLNYDGEIIIADDLMVLEI